MKPNSKFLLSVFFAVSFLLITTLVRASDLTSASFIIHDPVIGTFGGYGTSTNFTLISTGHTTLSGYSTSASFIVKSGFLYYDEEGGDETITFDIDMTADNTCDTDESGAPYIVALGTITAAAPRVSGATDGVNNICIDLDTNASGGAVVTVVNANGANGLASTSVPADDIDSVDGSIGANTERYGLCIVTSSASTGTLDDEGGYNGDTCAANSETNNIQELSTSPENIFDTNGAAVEGGRGQISVNASITTTTPAHADYTDALTFIVTGTF